MAFIRAHRWVEQPRSQHLVLVGPVETLDAGILIGLSRFNVINENTVIFTSVRE